MKSGRRKGTRHRARSPRTTTAQRTEAVVGSTELMFGEKAEGQARRALVQSPVCNASLQSGQRPAPPAGPLSRDTSGRSFVYRPGIQLLSQETKSHLAQGARWPPGCQGNGEGLSWMPSFAEQ